MILKIDFLKTSLISSVLHPLTAAQGFSCEISEVFRRTYYKKHLQTAVSVSKSLQTLLKDTPTHVFSCEIYEISKKIFVHRILPVAGSVLSKISLVVAICSGLRSSTTS